jgi:hypothetical protein
VNETAQILESLLQHPGWRLFREHIDAEWGTNGREYHAELEKALDLLDNDAAASQARQVTSYRKRLERLVTWPSEELQRLKRAEQKPELTMSRRGGL